MNACAYFGALAKGALKCRSAKEGKEACACVLEREQTYLGGNKCQLT